MIDQFAPPRGGGNRNRVENRFHDAVARMRDPRRARAQRGDPGRSRKQSRKRETAFRIEYRRAVFHRGYQAAHTYVTAVCDDSPASITRSIALNRSAYVFRPIITRL